MVTDRLITLDTRKEFIEAFRKLFIVNYNELFPKRNISDEFNVGYALNNWTMFFYFDKENSIRTIVELVTEPTKANNKTMEKSNSVEDIIAERMAQFAMNIAEIEIGQSISDKDGSICTVTDKTKNSVGVYIPKKAVSGINSKQYFDMRSFNERFKLK